jgi:hypothetical protein
MPGQPEDDTTEVMFTQQGAGSANRFQTSLENDDSRLENIR